MSIYDDIPTTKQGVITFREYAINQIRTLQINIKRLEKFIVECDRRLEENFKGEK